MCVGLIQTSKTQFFSHNFRMQNFQNYKKQKNKNKNKKTKQTFSGISKGRGGILLYSKIEKKQKNFFQISKIRVGRMWTIKQYFFGGRGALSIISCI